MQPRCTDCSVQQPAGASVVHIILDVIILYYSISYNSKVNYIVVCYIASYDMIQHVYYDIRLYRIMLYCTITLYYSVLYYIILYHIILYWPPYDFSIVVDAAATVTIAVAVAVAGTRTAAIYVIATPSTSTTVT